MTMNENEKHGKIPSTEEAWEARKLGADEAFVEKVSNEDIQEQIDRRCRNETDFYSVGTADDRCPQVSGVKK